MKHLSPTEAAGLLHRQADALLIDCRSEIEYLFVGHPVGAHHVAWSDAPDWEVNPRFADEVRQLAGRALNRPVLLICRSGVRSVDAGLALEAAGFTEVINVLDGFEGQLDDSHHRGTLAGWRHAGLPWEQS